MRLLMRFLISRCLFYCVVSVCFFVFLLAQSEGWRCGFVRIFASFLFYSAYLNSCYYVKKLVSVLLPSSPIQVATMQAFSGV